MADKIMDEAIAESNKLLIHTPFAATALLVKEDGRSVYRWQDNSTQAKSARTQIRKHLGAAWQFILMGTLFFCGQHVHNAKHLQH